MTKPKSPWNEARVRSFITSVIRGGYRRWPPKYEALEKAYVGKKLNTSSGRVGKHYLCNQCLKEFPSAQVQVDHIEPAVDPKIGFVNWDTFIQRLFCGVENLQVLCVNCHKSKTLQEKQQRKITSDCS